MAVMEQCELIASTIHALMISQQLHVHCCSVSSAISLNASVFASVCLASRLSSSLDAFVMVALAVQLFAFFPELRTSLRVSLLTYRQLMC